jgi:signal peptidase
MYGALLGIIFVIVILIFGANTNGASVLTYVYSNSMEPLIRVNDAFLVWPIKNLKTGDIVMYRPVVLKASYITHRIIATGETGFITKGDNAPYQDQESGEPEVTIDRIIGKVVTVNGKPLVIPGLGKLASTVQSGIGAYVRVLSVIFLIAGVLLSVIGGRKSVRKLKPRRRLRLRNVYKAISITAAVIIILSIYLGSRVTRVEYLVSEYPGDVGNQIEVNKEDILRMEVLNNGFFPEWVVMTGIAPISVLKGPEYVLPRSRGRAVLRVSPQRETGIYQGYVQVWHYPILLPRVLILFLHAIHPLLAIIMEGLALGVYSMLFFKILEHIHGFEGFIPLRAIRDKIIGRRLKRMGAKLFGRGRER